MAFNSFAIYGIVYHNTTDASRKTIEPAHINLRSDYCLCGNLFNYHFTVVLYSLDKRQFVVEIHTLSRARARFIAVCLAIGQPRSQAPSFSRPVSRARRETLGTRLAIRGLGRGKGRERELSLPFLFLTPGSATRELARRLKVFQSVMHQLKYFGHTSGGLLRKGGGGRQRFVFLIKFSLYKSIRGGGGFWCFLFPCSCFPGFILFLSP